MSTIVKVGYEGEFRKWKVDEGSLSFQGLLNEIRNRFGINTQNPSLKYKDSDGDYITVESDDDLRVALETETKLVIAISEQQSTVPGKAITPFNNTQDDLSSHVKTDNVATIEPSSLEEVDLNGLKNGIKRDSKQHFDGGVQPPPLKDIPLSDHHFDNASAPSEKHSPVHKFAPMDSLNNGYESNVSASPQPPTFNTINQPPIGGFQNQQQHQQPSNFPPSSGFNAPSHAAAPPSHMPPPPSSGYQQQQPPNFPPSSGFNAPSHAGAPPSHMPPPPSSGYQQQQQPNLPPPSSGFNLPPHAGAPPSHMPPPPSSGYQQQQPPNFPPSSGFNAPSHAAAPPSHMPPPPSSGYQQQQQPNFPPSSGFNAPSHAAAPPSQMPPPPSSGYQQQQPPNFPPSSGFNAPSHAAAPPSHMSPPHSTFLARLEKNEVPTSSVYQQQAQQPNLPPPASGFNQQPGQMPPPSTLSTGQSPYIPQMNPFSKPRMQ